MTARARPRTWPAIAAVVTIFLVADLVGLGPFGTLGRTGPRGGVAYAEARPPFGARLTGSLPSAPTTLDPALARSAADVTLAGLLFDTLYRMAPDGRALPHLAAAAPELSSDGLTARITLRAGVRFSDGRPLRAADVVASLQRAAQTPGDEWTLAPVKKIARDKETLVLTLARPTPELTLLLAAPALSITPGGKAPKDPAPIGSGPFALRKLDVTGRRVELEAAPDHFAGRPYVDAITLRWFERPDDEARAYEAGDADVSLRGAVAFAGHQPKYPTDAVDGPATLLVYVGFGRAHAELDGDRDFRRGLSLAVNRGAFKHVGAGERALPARLPESPDLGGAALSAADGDAHVEDARAAFARAATRRPELAAALKRPGGADGTLTLALIYDKTRLDDAEIAQRVAAALDGAGLSATYTALDPREYARRVAAGQCDLYIGQLVAPSPDVLYEYAAAFAAGGDKWLTQKIAAAGLTVAAAATAFADRLPVVPLLHRASRASHKSILHGLAFDALGRLGWADAYVFAAPAPSPGAP